MKTSRKKVFSLSSMITCMSDILCVTNRRLCSEDFLTQLGKIAEARPAGIILREKDLPEEEYMEIPMTIPNAINKTPTISLVSLVCSWFFFFCAFFI